MTIAVFGATGNTGSKFIDKINFEEFRVKALVRNTSKINSEALAKMELVVGDVLDQQKVDEVVKGTDAIVSFLGHSKKTSRNLQKQAIINILRSMSQNDVHRIIVMTGAGVVFPNEKPNLVDFFLVQIMKVFARKRLFDAIDMCNIIIQSDVDWTIFRCPALNNLKSNKLPRVFDRLSSRIVLTVSRFKVVNFILKELKTNKFIKKAPVLSDF